MNKTKKSLLASGLSLLVCAALLVGTTFAWFTDSVTNKGNSIQAGSLLINAYAYKLGDGGQTCTIPGVNGDQAFTFTATPQDLKTDPTPIISEPMWEPGASSAKLLQVTNDGTLAAKISLQFATSGDLTDALWFDFIQIDENGDTVGQFTQRPMNTLATFAENLELPLDAGATVRFVLVYGMYTTAGSEYMGDSFTADVTVLATQNTKEADGFGNTDYDQAAAYTADVSNEAELLEAVQKGQNVRLAASITLSQNVTFDQPAVFDLNNQNITVNNGTGSIKTTDNLTVTGSGTIRGALVADTGASLTIDAGEDFKIESSLVTGAAISAALNTTLEINGGTYTSFSKGGAGVINFLGSEATIRKAIVRVGADSMSQSAGIVCANAKTTLLENVVVNAKYGVAVQLNTSMSGNATIIGGQFITEKVAEGWNPNPTIKYGGTLTISDAEITRIGVGILYYKSWPKPADVEGLTRSNLTFKLAAESAAAYEEVTHNK